MLIKPSSVSFLLTSIIFIFALCILLYESYIFLGWQTDDAFISRVVVKNYLINGFFSWDSLALNNEASTTSFVHVIIIYTLQLLAGFDNIAKMEIFLNFSILLFSFFYFFNNSNNKNNFLQIWLLSLISAPYAVFWMFSGLETGILVGLISYIFIHGLLYLSGELNRPPSWLFVAICAVVRPDYIFVILSLAIMIFAKEGKEASLRYVAKSLIIVIIYYFIIFFYLGGVLPASYYFKVESIPRLDLIIRGVGYIGFYLIVSLFLPLLLFVLSGLVSKRRINIFFVFFLSLSLIPAAATINGGDWMAGFRFYAPFMIPFFFGCFYFLASYGSIKKTRRLFLTLTISLGLFVTNILVSDLIVNRESNNNFEQMVIKNRQFRSFNPDFSFEHLYSEMIELINNTEEISHVGLSEAGYIPFHVSKTSTDIQGLTHIELAKIRSESGVNSAAFMNWLEDRKISHFIFWLKKSENVYLPRVSKEVASHFLGDFQTLESCTYSKKVEDIYRFTHGTKGPLYVCLIQNPSFTDYEVKSN